MAIEVRQPARLVLLLYFTYPAVMASIWSSLMLATCNTISNWDWPVWQPARRVLRLYFTYPAVMASIWSSLMLATCSTISNWDWAVLYTTALLVRTRDVGLPHRWDRTGSILQDTARVISSGLYLTLSANIVSNWSRCFDAERKNIPSCYWMLSLSLYFWKDSNWRRFVIW